ncbi:hypothetical protein [Streptomyces sp. NPDC003247]|uniref:hypothetical protein n=1 Tax=Streptomyces sp. NPDC003247 TaxID=3364677 RepID=UPI00368F95EE
MLEAAAAALALAGGTAVVGAMATDAWQATRDRVIALFHRDPDEQRAVAAQLDGNNALVAGAEDDERVRAALLPVWRLQLEALLAHQADARQALGELVAEARAGGTGASPRWTQTNTAHDNGRVYASLGGDVHVHPTGPEHAPAPLPVPAPDAREPASEPHPGPDAGPGERR